MSNKSFTTRRRESEELARPDIIGTHERNRAAQAALPAAEAEHAEAVTALARTRSAIKSRSGNHTPADLGDARDAVEHAELRATGARVEADAAGNAVRTLSTALADAVVPLIATALPGVPVVCTFLNDDTLVPHDNERPLVELVQTERETVDNRTGLLSGSVTVRYHRAKLHTALSRDLVQRAALLADVRVDASHPRTSTDVLDVMVVKVRAAAPALPYLPVLSLEIAEHGLSGDLAAELADRTRYINDGPIQAASIGDTPAYRSRQVFTMAEGLRVVSEDIAADGTRSLVVESSILVDDLNAAPGIAEELPHDIADILDGQVGTYRGGLGRIASAVLVKPEKYRETTELVGILNRSDLYPLRSVEAVPFLPVTEHHFRMELISTVTSKVHPDDFDNFENDEIENAA